MLARVGCRRHAPAVAATLRVVATNWRRFTGRPRTCRRCASGTSHPDAESWKGSWDDGASRKMLRLEAQPRSVRVNATALSFDAAIQEVARVKLQSRLGRADLDRTPAGRLYESRRRDETRLAAAIEHPVVVIPTAKPQLRVLLRHPRADTRRGAKIERRPRHRRDLACRNQCR